MIDFLQKVVFTCHDLKTLSDLMVLLQADEQCADLQRRLDNVRNKFAGVLNYFGEESTMTSLDFFSTLDKFVMVSSVLQGFDTVWLSAFIVGICHSTRKR